MKQEDIEFIAQELKARTGNLFSQEKDYLLQIRLKPIAHKNGFADLEALINALRLNKLSPLWQEVNDAVMITESLFMRDTQPFENLRKIMIPYLLSNRPNKLIRIWCAACSSGQEPYSIAMLLKELHLIPPSCRVEILATDICGMILERAKQGVYSQFEVQRGLPIQYLLKYFTKIEDKWQIKPEIKSMVNFQKQNLLQIPQNFQTFDIIFCRYVLIYFDVPTKQKVFNMISQHLAQDGFLVLGGSETSLGISSLFKTDPLHKGLYKPHQAQLAVV
jgi:chemotaxis protein methyltransferase CheR